MTKAMSTKPCPVWPKVTSLSHSAFGRTVDPVLDTQRLIADRRADCFATDDSTQSALAHQACNRVAGHRDVLLPKGEPDFALVAYLDVLLPDRLVLCLDLRMTLPARRLQRRKRNIINRTKSRDINCTSKPPTLRDGVCAPVAHVYRAEASSQTCLWPWCLFCLVAIPCGSSRSTRSAIGNVKKIVDGGVVGKMSLVVCSQQWGMSRSIRRVRLIDV